MKKGKTFWIGLSLLNLSLVALLGFLLRSKILFSLPFVNYKNVLNAHSHLAFSGWVGLTLLAFFIYDVLPQHFSAKKSYQAILWSIEICSLGMAVSFPFQGYALIPIIFSTLFILTTYVFGWMFFRGLRKATLYPPVRWLSVASVLSLMLSSVGPFTLGYLMITKSANSLLHRDAIYTFLHLQYNGFFTLGIFALFFHSLHQKGIHLSKAVKRFAALLVASVLPSLFLSLLWHNLVVFYVLAVAGCFLVLLSLLYFVPVFRSLLAANLFRHRLSRLLWISSFVSFGLKMLLTLGTIYSPLGHAVYGARPVIIGFLHLVFLGFVSFFLLGKTIEEGAFTKNDSIIAFPFYIFGAGVVANEVLLMLQGISVLVNTNSLLYNWLLWGAAILLVWGAASIAVAFYRNKKSYGFATIAFL